MTRETFEEAIKLATDGTGRSNEEAERWALKYLMMGGADNQRAAVDAANIEEAERLMMQSQREIDFQQCVTLRQRLYQQNEEISTLSCKREPEQLWKLTELETQLNCSIAMVENFRTKDAHGTPYSHEEAEAIARKELELPTLDVSAQTKTSSIPDLYGKTEDEVAKIVSDMAPDHSSIPSLLGKSAKDVEKLVSEL